MGKSERTRTFGKLTRKWENNVRWALEKCNGRECTRFVKRRLEASNERMC